MEAQESVIIPGGETIPAEGHHRIKCGKATKNVQKLFRSLIGKLSRGRIENSLSSHNRTRRPSHTCKADSVQQSGLLIGGIETIDEHRRSVDRSEHCGCNLDKCVVEHPMTEVSQGREAPTSSDRFAPCLPGIEKERLPECTAPTKPLVPAISKSPINEGDCEVPFRKRVFRVEVGKPCGVMNSPNGGFMSTTS